MERREWLEATSAGATVLASALALVGAAIGFSPLLSAAIVVLLVGVFATRDVETYSEVLSAAGEGQRGRQMRTWTALKVLGIFTHVLLFLAATILLLAALLRSNAIGYESLLLPAGTIVDGVRAFLALLLVALASVHHLSMIVPLHRSGSPFRGMIAISSAFAAGLFSISVHIVEAGAVQLGPLVIQPLDTPYLHLAAAGLVGIALLVLRSPPTLRLLLVGEEAYYRGHTTLSRKRSIAAPLALAATLLFAVLFGGAVLLVGLGDLFGVASRNAAVGGVLALLGLGAVVAGGGALALWRAGEDVPLYRQRTATTERIERAVLWSSAILGLVPAVIGVGLLLGHPVLGLPPARGLEAIGVAVLLWTGPPGYWYHRRRARIRSLESKFPDFLRDIAAGRQAGLTLEKSVRIAGQREYGALDGEIEKMADQLAWNVNFDEALRRFADRVDTPLVHRAVLLIEEADRAGGDVRSLLMAAARDSRELKTLEADRRTSMSLYTIVIYIAFFVFLGVTAAMFATFIPQIVEASGELGGGGGITGVTFGSITTAAYRQFYLTIGLVQAIGSGIVAGYIESGEITNGLKHVFIMVAVTLLAFTVLV